MSEVKILLADDEPDIVSLYREMLEENGTGQKKNPGADR